MYQVRDAVKKAGIVYQLGHQGRQTESYNKAKEAIDKGVLGKINLIEVCTNRNDPNGAWVYDIRITSYNVCYTKLLRLHQAGQTNKYRQPGSTNFKIH